MTGLQLRKRYLCTPALIGGVLAAFREAAAAGVGVFTVNGKMIDVAFIPGAERTLKLAKACGMYEGDLV